MAYAETHRIPLEIQFKILESAEDFEAQSVLVQVCKTWRRFILESSSRLRSHRYFDTLPLQVLYDTNRSDEETTLRLHKSTSLMKAFRWDRAARRFKWCKFDIAGGTRLKEKVGVEGFLQKHVNASWCQDDPLVLRPVGKDDMEIRSDLTTVMLRLTGTPNLGPPRKLPELQLKMESTSGNYSHMMEQAINSDRIKDVYQTVEKDGRNLIIFVRRNMRLLSQSEVVFQFMFSGEHYWVTEVE